MLGESALGFGVHSRLERAVDAAQGRCYRPPSFTARIEIEDAQVSWAPRSLTIAQRDRVGNFLEQCTTASRKLAGIAVNRIIAPKLPDLAGQTRAFKACRTHHARLFGRS